MSDTEPAPILTPGIDTYINLEDADALIASGMFAEPWNAATPTKRAQALRTATRLLDRQRWAGEREHSAQMLAWPRYGFRDAAGVPLSADLIPPAVASACAELALHLLNAGQLPGPAVQMRQLGDSMVMYFPHLADELPKHVRRLIESFLLIRSAHVAELLP